jgi:hypothetical protein
VTTPRSHSGVRSIREVVAELRRMRNMSCPYLTTFIEPIPMGARAAAEVKLKEAFEHWYDANIIPLVDDLERKIKVK